jgi:hypothetical protein
MADEAQLAILKKGTREWNEWRKKNPQASVDLSRARLRLTDLADVNLSGVDLKEADLIGSDLARANLSEANLTGAALVSAQLGDANLKKSILIGAVLNSASLVSSSLSESDLTDAYLVGADLTASNLSGTNFSNARLLGTNLKRANLQKTNLSEAHLNETIFADVDLSTVIGLDSCLHSGPSTVDHRTLGRSGRLPLAFLQGCGVPDSLIDYLPSLMGSAIQFYSCFISYSTKDEDFAGRLYTDLQSNGVRCWFAPHDIQGGKKIHDQIDQAIRTYDRLLLILSDDSMNSRWVKTEIAHAREKELNEGRQILFPISVVSFERIRAWKNFDADTGLDSAREIREYFIPDFSNWKTDHDAYAQAFDRLLKDLRNEKAAGV